MFLLYYSELMEEHQQDANRYNKADGKLIGTEQMDRHRALIRELIAYQPLIDKPTDKQTGEEGTGGQHELCRDEITEIHQGHSEQCNSIDSSHTE